MRLLCGISGLAVLSALLMLAGCAAKPPEPGTYRVLGRTYKVLDKAEGYAETGIASWYGKDFHGKKTANGEIYDMYGRTCAHKTLPLGTRVRIKNLENGREVEARINDRGPFVEGRIIDLTLTIAKELGMADQGIAMVRVEPLDGVTFEDGLFAWQIGSFADKANADRLTASLTPRFRNVRVVEAEVANRTVHRVQIGKYTSRTAALDEQWLVDDLCDKPWLVGYD